jgi:hypothetical protein
MARANHCHTRKTVRTLTDREEVDMNSGTADFGIYMVLVVII